jgi:protein-S-isoprenylcysteine O-methyltransferase Ste14
VSLRVLVGVALVIFYVVYLRATLRSLGPIGIGLAYALFGSVAWLLAQWQVLDLSVPDEQSIASLAISASVLGIGMSWSAIRYRISGQYDSEDVGVSPI